MKSIIRDFLNHKNLLTEDNERILLEVFKNLEEEELYYTLNPSISSLFSPFVFEDMDKICSKIIQNIKDNNNILIFGDRDLDGMIGTFILKHFLENLKKWFKSNSEIFYEVPEGNDIYGITPEDVRKYSDKVSLIITVDNGTSAIEALKEAKNLGIDVIITDHHELYNNDIFQYPYGILNPKIKKAEGKYLSGSGVTFFLILGVLIKKHYNNLDFSYINITNSNNIELTDVKNFIPKTYAIKLDDFRKKTDIAKRTLLFMDKQHLDRISRLVDLSRMVDKFYYFESVCSFFGLKECNFQKFLLDFNIPSFYSEGERLAKTMFLIHILNTDEIKNYIDTYLPLVGLSVLSDSMPYISYNKFFIKETVDKLDKINIDSMRFLVSEIVGNSRLNTWNLTMSVIPFINSAGRMGKGSKIIELLLENDVERMKSMISELRAINNSRKAIINEAVRKYSEVIKKDRVFVSNEIDKGIISILSTRLSNEVDFPIVLISNGGNGNTYSGSARFRNGDIFSIIMSLSKHLENFGGHKKAAGFVILEKNIQSFVEDFKKIDYTKFKDELKPLMKIKISEFYDRYGKLFYSIEPLNEEYKPVFEDRVVIQDFRRSYSGTLYQLNIDDRWFNVIYTDTDYIRKFVGTEVTILYSYDIVFKNNLQQEVFYPKILEIKDD